MDAADRWTAALQAWTIPAEILDAAPRDPYEFPPSIIRRPIVDPLSTPTGQVVLQRLAPAERLLDVGCGAARIAGAFVAAHEVIGVEPREALAKVARAAGVAVHLGRWPDLADTIGTAPVVLSTHVMYDVQQPAPFVQAMHAAAQRRVVLEVTQRHPWVHLGPLYRRFHDIDRPAGPTAQELADVVAEVVGISPRTHPWTRPGSTYDTLEALADQTARMLCLPPEKAVLAELATLVAEEGTVMPDGRIRLADADLVTLWWDTDA